ncbi:hypothetical protein [Streptomyces sp. NPDC059611]|uniref:hypothetical protein n=1 Tax=Streptomyces sp. NPDC059611 TaxID=3346884 RepID=UPI0036BF8FA8
MSTTFDQHVNEALALIAPARHRPTATQSARAASPEQHSRPQLTLVRRPAFQEGSEQ